MQLCETGPDWTLAHVGISATVVKAKYADLRPVQKNDGGKMVRKIAHALGLGSTDSFPNKTRMPPLHIIFCLKKN
jgi:glycine/serine hydroxymethyltransferase